MAPALMGTPDEALLSATYTTPSATKSFTHAISSPRLPDTAAKVAYLFELRASTKRLQDEINTFLTEKMEVDKTHAATSGAGTSGNQKRDPDEEEAEETYGEEKEDESS